MPDPGSLPLYVQISEILIRDIMAGRLIAGERLAPEREMARDLGTSVGTLRKALANLTDKGLLERRQGSGNYVRPASGPTGVYAFFRLERIAGGGLPTAQILSVDTRAKPADLPAFGGGEMAHRIRRLRRIGGVPVALEEIWLDDASATGFRAEDLSESLYLYYKTALGLWIMRAEDRVGLGHVPQWRPGAFGPTPGDAVPLIERTSADQSGAKVEFSYTWLDQSRARYVARIK